MFGDTRLSFTLEKGSNPTKWIKEHLKDDNFAKYIDAKFQTRDLNKLANIFDTQIKKQGLNSTKLQAGKEYTLDFGTSPEKGQNDSVINIKDSIIKLYDSDNCPPAGYVYKSVLPDVKKNNLLEKAENQIISDGKISNFTQGEVGDCTLLANIQALAMKQKGREILKQTLNKLPDGNFEVRFKGAPNKVYTVSKEEFFNGENKKLSTGDDDVKIIEIAARKYLMETQPERANRENKDILSGGFDSLKLLCGKETFIFINKSDEKGYTKKDSNLNSGSYNSCSMDDIKMLFENVLANNHDDYAIQVGFSNDIPESKVIKEHSYSINYIDNQSKLIELVNPHDNSQNLKVKYEDLFSNFHSLSYANLSEPLHIDKSEEKSKKSFWGQIKTKAASILSGK